MESIRGIESNFILETAKQVVAFMQELKTYELLVTSKDIDSGLLPIKAAPHIKVHRPFIDDHYPLKDIREFAWAIGLNSKMHAVYIDLLSIGDVTRTVIPRWSVYRGTYYYEAVSIIVIHNHPSGDPTPSTADIHFTEEIIKGGIFLERPLADHIILGDDCYYSFGEDQSHAGFDGLLKKVKDEARGVKILRQENIAQAKRIAELEAQLKGMHTTKD